MQAFRDSQGLPAHFASFFSYVGAIAPNVYKASVSDPDTLSYDEAMRDSNKPDWMAAATLEINNLSQKGTWIEVPKSQAKSRILPGTWVFRRKRNPDGTIKKFKGRYCVRGDLEEGEQDTFAPVVAFSTVRAFLVLSLSLSWYTASIDFEQAFVQATLDDPIWIHLPRGFTSTLGPDTCLELKKSLYGTRIAPKLWFLHARKAFVSLGFVSCPHDQCLLLRSDCLVVLYVDDAGIAAPTKAIVDKLISDLREQGLALTEEGSFTEFLGIKFSRLPDGAIELSQRGLTEKILQTMAMEDCSVNKTPTTQLGLGTDPDEPPMSEPWSYSSVVGMLLYLTLNTRPDIAFAVSQVARFTSAPKRTHATAVKMIARYLKGTVGKGMIIRPSGTLDLEAYVDADFAGLYQREPDHMPDAVRSRTGYLLTLGGCPLLWKSQLQTEIALSTVAAEYYALSQCMRVVLPMRSLILSVLSAINHPVKCPTKFKCKVYEDNMGAFYLATNQRLTSRTKYFLVKYHHFWEAVRAGDIVVEKVDTSLQNADYLTKGLPAEPFLANRQRVQGWLVWIDGKPHVKIHSGVPGSMDERESQDCDSQPVQTGLTKSRPLPTTPGSKNGDLKGSNNAMIVTYVPTTTGDHVQPLESGAVVAEPSIMVNGRGEISDPSPNVRESEHPSEAD